MPFAEDAALISEREQTMSLDFDRVYHDVCAWADAHGISVRQQSLQANKAGEFNGVSALMNSEYSAEERTYYLVHALGSMVRWFKSKAEIQAMFNELRDAKKDKTDTVRLERAIEHYRAFEIESSEFAVWLLENLGHAQVVASYTNFMRADLEALTLFHRTGKAPGWREFFTHWNEEVAQGQRQVPPFAPKPIPPFTPVRIEKQEILQEQG